MIPVPDLDTESGSVSRRGSDLVIVAPAAMPRSAWLTLEQEFVLQAEATSDDGRKLVVSIDRAADAREILARPWPAGRWRWSWSLEAENAAGRASTIQEAVDTLLNGEKVTATERMDDDLVAAGFSRRLLASQRDAVAQLVHAGGGGNFSVPGSGKTTMTYAVYALLRAAGIVDRLLVVAPQSAYEAWQEEARDCFSPESRPVIEIAPRSPLRRSEVLVYNYERASQGGIRAAVDAWALGHKFLVVFDEAHRAKRGSDGLHGFGALDLANLASARLVLTGTPLPNGPEDLVAVLDLAWPGQGARLASRHTPNADRSWVRITKRQLELEDAQVTIEPVRLDDSHQRIYDALSEGLANDPDAFTAHPEFAQRAVMRLVAAASNPALLLPSEESDQELLWPRELTTDSSLMSLLDNLRASSRPAKLLAAARHADAHAAEGKKLLVWTNFLGNVRELERLLAPHNPAVITGATPRSEPLASTDRERELERFRYDDDCVVLIATPQTLGEGISLHKACQSQLHVDRTFNAGLYLQAMDRTHRVGMPEGTHAKVTVLQSVDTIDERIDAALREKLTAMDNVLNDPTLTRLSQVSVGTASTGFTAGEVARLLGHLRT